MVVPLDHCILSDMLFNKIASRCQILSVLTSPGQYRYISRGVYTREASAISCVLDLLDVDNINSTVQLDIRGPHLSEQEIDAIERVHPTVPCVAGWILVAGKIFWRRSRHAKWAAKPRGTSN